MAEGHKPVVCKRRHGDNPMKNYTLAQARVDAGHTGSQMAKLVGVPTATYGVIESGRSLQRNQKVKGRIAGVLGMPVEELFPAQAVFKRGRRSKGVDERFVKEPVEDVLGLLSDAEKAFYSGRRTGLSELLFATQGRAFPEVKSTPEDEEKAIRSAYDILNLVGERDKAILSMHYGLEWNEPTSFAEIGRRIGMTRAGVASRHDRIIERLRKQIGVETDF